jgi:endoglucanase
VILRQLSEAPGPSGREEAVRQIIQEAIKDYVDEQRVDALGNLIAIKKGSGAPAGVPGKVLIAAHMDEVALMIMHIGKDGLLRFRKFGGIDDRVLMSKCVRIGEKRVPGVIGYKPIHLLKAREREMVVASDDLTIDIGVTSAEAAEKLVKLGDYAVFDTAYEEYAQSRVAKGKALDDRAGCAVLVELLQGERYSFDLIGLFTVQEEVGLRGARVAGYALAPDAAIILEGTVCDDLPKKQDLSPTTRLGYGPAITVMDHSFVADRRLVKLFTDAAAAEGIPYQIKQPLVGGTDAGAIHMTREGVPAIALAVPTRYIHSPVSLLSLDDLDNEIKLLKAALNKLGAQGLG